MKTINSTTLSHFFAVLRARWYFRNASYVGSRVRLWGRAFIQNEGELIIGERVRVQSSPVPVEMVIEPGGSSKLGPVRLSTTDAPSA